jgi:hypothetical protein
MPGLAAHVRIKCAASDLKHARQWRACVRAFCEWKRDERAADRRVRKLVRGESSCRENQRMAQ